MSLLPLLEQAVITACALIVPRGLGVHSGRTGFRFPCAYVIPWCWHATAGIGVPSELGLKLGRPFRPRVHHAAVLTAPLAERCADRRRTRHFSPHVVRPALPGRATVSPFMPALEAPTSSSFAIVPVCTR